MNLKAKCKHISPWEKQNHSSILCGALSLDNSLFAFISFEKQERVWMRMVTIAPTLKGSQKD